MLDRMKIIKEAVRDCLTNDEKNKLSTMEASFNVLNDTQIDDVFDSYMDIIEIANERRPYMY